MQIAGTLVNLSTEGEGRRKRLTAVLYDDTGKIELVWFQNVGWLTKSLREYDKYIVYGKINVFNGFVNIVHPEIEPFKTDTTVIGRQPVYSTTQKLEARGISNRNFAKLTQALFERLQESDIEEFLPPGLLESYQLMPRSQAFANIHFPQSEALEQAAVHRLKWEELFASQMMVARLKQSHVQQQGWVFAQVGSHFNNFYKEQLPFALTNAQKRVLKEIRTDTLKGAQMNRLVQGDVGSGKTIVALMAMLLALDNGFQACMMAPTEILARQHYRGISELLEPMGIQVAFLSGTVKGKERKQILAQLQDGNIPIVIGTHALIEDPVQFRNLGLAIIDEQHRFGVDQRARLWKKNNLPPHILVMTATPIPRTLAMTLYGDLDVSVIDELPPGRQVIKTVHRFDAQRAGVMQFTRTEIDKGRQVYIVYPLIEESEKLDYESLLAGYEQVKMWFPDHKYHIAMVHGQQDRDERERNMERFVQGKAHIMVATTVIEVGVNVPNASVMLIESAERFGLSQLHQLRGRVGRGSEQSYCILLTGNNLSEEGKKRMHIMCSSSNGFEIAEKDLEIRGPGDMYGTRQSGTLSFKLADIVMDSHILEETRHAALQLMQQDPQLQRPENIKLQNLFKQHKQQSYWSQIS